MLHREWLIETATGSKYRLAQLSDGTTWLSGVNVINPFSQPLPNREYQVVVKSSLPPIVGRSLFAECIHFSAPDHPNRMPGGGKITSPILRITELTETDEAA